MVPLLKARCAVAAGSVLAPKAFASIELFKAWQYAGQSKRDSLIVEPRRLAGHVPCTCASMSEDIVGVRVVNSVLVSIPAH